MSLHTLPKNKALCVFFISKVNPLPSNILYELGSVYTVSGLYYLRINAKVSYRDMASECSVSRAHNGDYNFLRAVSNFVWHVYVLLVWRLGGNAYKFPSPWHKSSHRLLFWEVLWHQAIVVPSPLFSCFAALSPGFAWCEVFLMVYVTKPFWQQDLEFD